MKSSAPAVHVTVSRSFFLPVLLTTLSLFPLSAWLYFLYDNSAASDGIVLINLGVLVAAITLACRQMQHFYTGPLSWDGSVWLWGESGGQSSKVGKMLPRWDLGNWVFAVLCSDAESTALTPESNRKSRENNTWVCVSQAAMSADAWRAFRRALYLPDK